MARDEEITQFSTEVHAKDIETTVVDHIASYYAQTLIDAYRYNVISADDVDNYIDQVRDEAAEWFKQQPSQVLLRGGASMSGKISSQLALIVVNNAIDEFAVSELATTWNNKITALEASTRDTLRPRHAAPSEADTDTINTVDE